MKKKTASIINRKASFTPYCGVGSASRATGSSKLVPGSAVSGIRRWYSGRSNVGALSLTSMMVMFRLITYRSNSRSTLRSQKFTASSTDGVRYEFKESATRYHA